MKIELITLVVLSVLVNSLIAQNYDGPCGQWHQDADLGTFDVLSSYGDYLESFTRVEGSNSIQTSYRLEHAANLTMSAQESFPRGVPFEFSFECTYRERKPQPEPWHLFHLTNSHEESQLSVTLNPSKQTLQVTLPDARGDLQTVEFRHSGLFDQRWHKIMLGVTEKRAKLWVDCQQVKSIDGYLDTPLRERGHYDTQDGFLSVAQIEDAQRRFQIDLQWMVMTCDPDRPLHQNCDEIPGYEVAGVAPEAPMFAEGPSEKPCQVCPRGPAGFNGTDGRPGARGPPGPMGIPGFSAAPIKGERGEQGLRGLDGRPGENGRDGIPGQRGERGAPGLPGSQSFSSSGNVAVRVGQKGEMGETGLMGLQGMRGERGFAGADGRPGRDGAAGEKGEMGQRGFDGQSGLPGPPGPPGQPGLQGGDGGETRSGMGVHYVLGGGAGPRGEQGNPGPRGQPGAPGENGRPGRSFSEEEVREICYGVLRGQIEELTANLQGPPGPPGVGKRGQPGPQGTQGVQGEKGRQGFQGLQGLPGLAGPQGEQGYQGEQGEKGERGDRGEEGVGRPGQQGPQGPQGPTGADGAQGHPGRIGNTGEQGASGQVGPRGPPGSPGQCPADCWQAVNQANALYFQRAQGNQKGP